ncbi:MAG: nucleotide exchange factor GrpE, partial [Nanoarchaeota archaeon]
PMETVGKKFDPYYHEALVKIPSDKEENTILEEFQKGYLMHSKVLRHAKVKVSAGKTNVQKNK